MLELLKSWEENTPQASKLILKVKPAMWTPLVISQHLQVYLTPPWSFTPESHYWIQQLAENSWGQHQPQPGLSAPPQGHDCIPRLGALANTSLAWKDTQGE